MTVKPKLAIFWAASCGGCEIAITNLNEKFLALDSCFDLAFCPCLMDAKKTDIEAMADNAIALALFNGAVRTSENEEMARLLRSKSELLVAFGSCASEGCIPGLSNLHSRSSHFSSIFLTNPSLDNPKGTIPLTITHVPEGELELPEFYERVKPLREVVDVDYFIRGCPPEPPQIWNVIDSIIQGRPLPPKGSTLGVGTSSVCDECARKRENKKISRFYRTFEIIPDPTRCLLDQGILCMGIATSDGCGALCPQVNMPCTGCYGPPATVQDQGAKMIAALGSVLEIGEYKGLSDEQIMDRADAILDSLPDPAGTFYKYSLPGSLLGGKTAENRR